MLPASNKKSFPLFVKDNSDVPTLETKEHTYMVWHCKL